jgi:hypothetical protein
MDDIELTKKINSLKWEVDLNAGTIKSELVHYKIVEGKFAGTAPFGTYLFGTGENVSLIGCYASAELNCVAATSVWNAINRAANAAYREAATCREKGIPTAAEFKTWKLRHGTTGARLALLCGVEPRTVRQWLSGDRRMPLPCWRLLRILLGDITPADAISEAEARIE